MNFVYPIFISIILLIISLPFAKNYQLKGYNIESFILNFFEIKFSLHGKNKLNLTKRMLRFLILLFLLEYLFWLAIFLYNRIIWLFFIDFLINLLIFPLFFAISHYILLPVEILIKKIYVFKLKNKFKKFNGKVIAITGSYGKTSVKNILSKLLSEKYRVLFPPKNFNTPMGLCKAFLKENFDLYDIILVEMGARHVGDINELCKIVQPDVGVITSVGNMHIQTFGSLENVKKTKFELCENLENKICFFDCYGEETSELFERAKCKKMALGKDVFVDISSCDKFGSQFEISFKDKKLELKSPLLGEFACRNIALSFLVAREFEIGEKNIQEVIRTLKPVPHRLEVVRNDDVTIIDDSYNSNFNGFVDALHVLKMFNGEKILITPGMVELGNLQYELNFKIGKIIAKCCDKVIIMNKTNKIALKNGIESENKSKIEVFYADERKTQKEILSKIIEKNSVVLFENDLPDDYL